MTLPAGQTIDVPLDIVGSNIFGRYPKISDEQTFNMMISDGWLVPFPGYKKVTASALSGYGRTLYRSTNYKHMIGIFDSGVFVIDSDLGFSLIGSIDSSTGNVFIAENNAGQIAISTGKSIYIFNYNNSTFQKADTTGWLPGYIAFQDTYFIAIDSLTNQWRLSENNNGLMWPNDSSSIGEYQSKASPLVASVPFPGKGNLLVIFSKTGCEFWYNLGYQLFPYQRNTFSNLNYGCLNADTIASENDLLVWLASNEQAGTMIMYTNGGEPQKISTDGIDFKLARLSEPENSYGFLITLDGHRFYIITFPADNITYAYDFNVNKFYTLTDENMNYFIMKRCCFFDNTYYFVSFKDGYLYELSGTYNDYDGKPIPRIRVCKTLRMPDNSPFIVNKMEIISEQGQNQSLQAIERAFSKDGAEIFSSFRRKNFNEFAVRRNRMRWWGGGYSNEFTPMFRFWGNSRFVLQNGVTSVYQ